MDDSQVRIDEIQAAIRASLDRAKALIAESERFTREYSLPDGAGRPRKALKPTSRPN